MNLRQFSMAILISALPIALLADHNIAFDRGDFISAKAVERDGETILSVKLSKSGKAKIRKLNQSALNKQVHADIAGVTSDFRLREPITGDSLEMGPYSSENARKVVNEINQP